MLFMVCVKLLVYLFKGAWDTHGTLTDHPGWILGQNIEVK